MRGQGMSRTILLEMKELARRNGPARCGRPRSPHLGQTRDIQNSQSTNMRTGVEKTDNSTTPGFGLTNELGGPSVLGIAPRAFSVIASVADWQRWTGVRFDHTGAYVVPGALVPVERKLSVILTRALSTSNSAAGI